MEKAMQEIEPSEMTEDDRMLVIQEALKTVDWTPLTEDEIMESGPVDFGDGNEAWPVKWGSFVLLGATFDAVMFDNGMFMFGGEELDKMYGADQTRQ